MMGSFLTRGLVLIFGYAYPAYECFKTVEKNKPEIEQLLFWCQYWILVALLTVFERVGDTFVSWVPMYSEAKLAFFIYLWYPKTKGTTYVYDSFFRPYVAKHEPEIDRNLLELKTRAGDIAVVYWQKGATYVQTRVFDVLQYIASQSTSRPRPSEGVETRRPPPIVRTRQEDATSQKPPQQPPQLPQQAPTRTSSAPTQKHQASPSRTSSMNSTQQQQQPPGTSSAGTSSQQQESTLEKVPPSTASASASAVQPEVTAASKPDTQSTRNPTQAVVEAMQVEESGSSLSNGNTNSPPQETVMEDIIRVTRGRLRKNRAVSKG